MYNSSYKHTGNRIDSEVADLQYRELIKALPLNLAFSLIVTVIVGYLLYLHVDKDWALIWFSLSVLMVFLRFHVVYASSKRQLSLKFLTLYNNTIAFMSGLVWASLIFFYDTTLPLELQLILLMVIGAMPIASLSTNANVFSSHLFFALPCVVVLNLWALTGPIQFNMGFFIMTLIFSFLVLVTSYRFNQRLKQSFISLLENNELIEELKQQQTLLENLAYVDSLTGLYNRRYFTTSAELGLSMILQKNAKLYFFLVDADKFKDINDEFGHAAGDKVLVHLADCLKRSVNQFNQNPLYESGQMAEAARLGGDEFIISYLVLEDDFSIEETASLLLDDINRPIKLGNNIIHPQASIGVSEAPRQAQDISGLLRLGDKAMYQAKKRSGNQVFYCISNDFNHADS